MYTVSEKRLKTEKALKKRLVCRRSMRYDLGMCICSFPENIYNMTSRTVLNHSFATCYMYWQLSFPWAGASYAACRNRTYIEYRPILRIMDDGAVMSGYPLVDDGLPCCFYACAEQNLSETGAPRAHQLHDSLQRHWNDPYP